MQEIEVRASSFYTSKRTLLLQTHMGNMVNRARQLRTRASAPPLYVEQGGKLADIRDLCSLERVRDYHSKYYHVRSIFVASSFDCSFRFSASQYVDCARWLDASKRNSRLYGAHRHR